jgi:hypothetical protein
VAGSGASCLGRTLLAFFPLGLDNLADPTLLVVEPLFAGNLVKLSSLEINSSSLVPLLLVELSTLAKLAALAGEPLFVGGLVDPALLAVEPLFGDLVGLSSSETNSGSLAPLSLVELPTLAKLAALAGELLFVDSLAELALVLLTLEVGLIPTEGLVGLVVLVVAEPIFIDGPAPLALLNCSAESPSIEFSSFKLSRAIAPIESTGFFLGIQVFILLIPPSNSIALILSISASLFCSWVSLLGISKILRISFIDRIGIS